MNTALRILNVIVLALLCSCKPGETGKEMIVSIKTTLGDIKVRLYDETPVHRDNFLKLVNSGFYEGISFHRVINGFMIQAGDPATKPASSDSSSDTINYYTIPPEFNRKLYHKKGALAAARQGNEVNPGMRSSGTQFYIVQGEIQDDADLFLAEQTINSGIKQAYFVRIFNEISDSLRKAGSEATPAEIQEMTSLRLFDIPEMREPYRLNAAQINDYKSIGGLPRLDGTYTVFGEVVSGLEIVDRIASAQTDQNDRPITDIKIVRMKIEK